MHKNLSTYSDFPSFHAQSPKAYRWLAIIGLLLILGLLAEKSQASVSASVDRNDISMNDVLQLTLRSTDGAIENDVELAELLKDFTLLNQQQSNQIRIINGRKSSNHDLILLLAPKRPGQLNIPAIRVNQQLTKPIKIKVRPPGTAAQGSVPIFMENRVDRMEVYVQAQIIYTSRLFFPESISWSDASLSDLDLNAVVEKLDENRYQSWREGIRYQVIETRYHISPQSSGTLEIPEQTFTARISGRHGGYVLPRNRFFRTASEAFVINVLPKPASYPSDQPWLPASSLSLTDNWYDPVSRVILGEPITRTITLTASGLSSAQLPRFSAATQSNLKLYPDKAVTDDRTEESGLIGEISQAVALVPTETGLIELPTQTVYWWNTEKNRLETAKLTGRKLLVESSATAAGPEAFGPGKSQEPDSSLSADNAEQQTGLLSGSHWFWVALVCAIGWLTTLLLWFKKPRHISAHPITEQHLNNEGAVFKNFTQGYRATAEACRKNNPQQAQQCLLGWLKVARPEHKMQHLQDASVLFSQEDWRAAIRELDAHLYANCTDGDANVWDGQNLLNAIEAYRADLAESLQEKSAAGLPPLYPEFGHK